ncbi:MAG: hypothetical protein AAF944_02750 [Bacteroidota bacterium]
MKFSFYLFGSLFLMMGLSACFSEPEYEEAPVITAIEDLYFVDVQGGFDSLVVSVAFTDGDGDLGLSSRELDNDRFGPFELPLPRRDGALVKLGSYNDLPEFNCEDYTFPADLTNPVIDGETITDTILVKRNPFVTNFEVTIFIRQEGGEYEELNFRRELCRPPLGGRFSPLKDNFSNDNPRVGTITHFASSRSFKSLFRNDSLKIGVVIRDRSGNESNMFIKEDAFTLNEITRLPE